MLAFDDTIQRQDQTYHLESVEFLFDLLSKHRSKTVARSNISSAIIVGGRPRIIELNTRAEADVSRTTLRGGRHALGRRHASATEVVASG